MRTYEDVLADRKERCRLLKESLSQLNPQGRAGEFTLELGCGHGHFLTAYAEQHPDEHCLGIDLITKRIQKSNAKRDRLGLTNLHFIKADAFELLESMPDGLSIGRIFMLFPDPWPKKRHHKNRMLQHSLLNQLAAQSTSTALLHFRSDHEENFQWACEQIEQNPNWQIDPAATWPFETETYFQSLMSSWQSFVARRV